MKKISLIAILLLLIVAGDAAWQIGTVVVANANFHEEIRDLAAQPGTNIGFVARKTDDDIVETVVARAREHGIDLEPSQVTVRRTDSGSRTTLYLAADYNASLKLPFLTLKFHFTPSSDR
jgi:hypothetical protein